MKFLLPREEIVSENLRGLITDVFEQNSHITFLCDETLLNGFFNEFIDELTDYELEPIEIAASIAKFLIIYHNRSYGILNRF